MTDQPTPTPTPRTDALAVKWAGDPDARGYREELEAFARELERELAAITCEDGELWELRQENARLKDNLASLSKLHAGEMSKAQSSFDRELAAERVDHATTADMLATLRCELEAERALADRLAETMRQVAEGCNDAWCRDDATVALAAWKAARNEAVNPP